jgi:hypothetical protein
MSIFYKVKSKTFLDSGAQSRVTGDFSGQSLVPYFFILSPPQRPVLVLLLVLAGLHRLASNTSSKHLRALSGHLPDPSRAVSEAPFEYEYDQEQTSIATDIPE